MPLEDLQKVQIFTDGINRATSAAAVFKETELSDISDVISLIDFCTLLSSRLLRLP